MRHERGSDEIGSNRFFSKYLDPGPARPVAPLAGPSLPAFRSPTHLSSPRM